MPLADDDKPVSMDVVVGRVRRALLELGSIREIGGDADAHLLEAEQALRKVLRAVGAA